jgi:hypothetical protein
MEEGEMNLYWRTPPPRSFRLKAALFILDVGIWIAERIHGAALSTYMKDADMLYMDDVIDFNSKWR